MYTEIAEKVLWLLGWRAGMGLGRIHQGIIEPIKIYYKNKFENKATLTYYTPKLQAITMDKLCASMPLIGRIYGGLADYKIQLPEITVSTPIGPITTLADTGSEIACISEQLWTKLREE